MKPRTILLLAFLIFACVIGCVMGNFGNGITLTINGQPVVFKAFIPVIAVPAEMIGEPWFYIGDTPIGLYNTLFTTLIVDAVIAGASSCGWALYLQVAPWSQLQGSTVHSNPRPGEYKTICRDPVEG